MAYTTNRTFNFKCDTSDFMKKSEELRRELIKGAPEDVRYAANVFANAAAKSTPPSIGKPAIDKKYYTRPFYVLIRLIRGGYRGVAATGEDIAQFKAGMVYKVLSTKGHTARENVAFGYCKTKSALRRMRKIETRGLMRVMWGKSLGDIGANVPGAIQRLLNKSERLKDLPYSSTTLTTSDDEVTAEIVNKAEGIERVASYAKAVALKKTKAALLRRVKERVSSIDKDL